MLGLELITMAFKLRRATASDADAIADVYSASFRLLTFLPMLHHRRVSMVYCQRDPEGMRGHGCRR
jgi:hypothetical protein